MKKKNWIQFLKKTLIIFVMVVFAVFSTGFLVSIHECCHAHKHEVCKVHQPDEVQHSDCTSEIDPESNCCEKESMPNSSQTSENKVNHSDGCPCDNHDHCLVLTFLIKITDNFVVSDLLKDQLKSPTPIALFNQEFNNIERNSLIEEHADAFIYSPPKIHLGGKNFINFTSQRVYYA